MTIVAGENDLAGSMERETHFLGLMSVDEEVNVPVPAKLGELVGLLSSSPEEQICRAVTLKVGVVEMVLADYVGVKSGHFCW